MAGGVAVAVAESLGEAAEGLAVVEGRIACAMEEKGRQGGGWIVGQGGYIT